MREEVRRLVELGPLPDSQAAEERINEYAQLLDSIYDARPVTEEEAKALLCLFRRDEDETYGLGWTLLHIVETAPSWPLTECLQDDANPWIHRLRRRAARAGKL